MSAAAGPWGRQPKGLRETESAMDAVRAIERLSRARGCTPEECGPALYGLPPHLATVECWCGPEVEDWGGCYMVVHVAGAC
jgi:hypothetical protein